MAKVEGSGASTTVVVNVHDGDARNTHLINGALSRCRVSIYVADIGLLYLFEVDVGVTKGSLLSNFSQIVVIVVVLARTVESGHPITDDKDSWAFVCCFNH